jgi:hypothetical protein
MRPAAGEGQVGSPLAGSAGRPAVISLAPEDHCLFSRANGELRPVPSESEEG